MPLALDAGILQLEKATSGEINFAGTDLTKLSQEELIPFRQKIQVIFQDRDQLAKSSPEDRFHHR